MKKITLTLIILKLLVIPTKQCKTLNTIDDSIFQKAFNNPNFINVLNTSDKTIRGMIGYITPVFYYLDENLELLKNGKKTGVIINSILIKNSKEKNLVEKQIKFLEKFSDSNYTIKLIDCYYAENSNYEGIKEFFKEEENSEFKAYFIITEKFYSPLFPQINLFKKITPKTRINSYIDLFKGLKIFQKNSLINLNINPYNIMITKPIDHKNNFKLKFYDFLKMEIINKSVSNTGIVSYMAPKLFKSTKSSFKFDIYSLTAIIGFLEFDVEKFSNCDGNFEDFCSQDFLINGLYASYVKKYHVKEVTIREQKKYQLGTMKIFEDNFCESLICFVIKYLYNSEADFDYDIDAIIEELTFIGEKMDNSLKQINYKIV